MPLPVLFLGKVHSPLLQVSSLLVLPSGIAQRGLSLGSPPCAPNCALHPIQPFTSHLKWARVWTQPLQDNAIIYRSS